MQSRYVADWAGRDDFVLLQTPVRDGGIHSQARATLLLDDEIAAIGFKGIFDRWWARALSNDESLAALEGTLERLRSQPS